MKVAWENVSYVIIYIMVLRFITIYVYSFIVNLHYFFRNGSSRLRQFLLIFFSARCLHRFIYYHRAYLILLGFFSFVQKRVLPAQTTPISLEVFMGGSRLILAPV